MKLRLVGCSHHASSVAVREQLAFNAEQTVDALAKFRLAYPEVEAVLLSTCNRVELYVGRGDAGALPTTNELISFLAEYHGVESIPLRDQLFCSEGTKVVRHLFFVAASLDSMVVGEPQILAQVKQAFAAAQEAGTNGPLGHHLFETAYKVAKRVATETEIHRRRVSIPSVAVADYAKQLFETFRNKKILLLGAGEMGQETLRYLNDEGAKEIVVLNRNRQRAEVLAQEITADVDDWDHLAERIAWADLIVSTTAAREPVVTAAQFRKLHQQRSERLLFVLDLAVPRDFEASIGGYTNVYLYCIDDLRAVCERNRKAREKEWPRAERIIEEEVERFLADRNHRATVPTIQRLRQQADRLKEDELERLWNKLGELDPQDRAEIEQSFGRLVNKLLHPPLASLRDEAKKGSHHSLLDALRHLFQISD